MTRTSALAMAAVVSGIGLAAQSAVMRPGKYEATAEMALGGRAMKMPPQKVTLCITPADLKDWSRNIVKTSEGVTCKLSEYKPDGPVLTFARECTSSSGRRTTYTGEVTFRPPDSYQAVVHVNSAGGDESNALLRNSVITTTARRVGDCMK